MADDRARRQAVPAFAIGTPGLQEIVEIEGRGPHLQTAVPIPGVARPIAVQLDAMAVRIAQI